MLDDNIKGIRTQLRPVGKVNLVSTTRCRTTGIAQAGYFGSVQTATSV